MIFSSCCLSRVRLTSFMLGTGSDACEGFGRPCCGLRGGDYAESLGHDARRQQRSGPVPRCVYGTTRIPDTQALRSRRSANAQGGDHPARWLVFIVFSSCFQSCFWFVAVQNSRTHCYLLLPALFIRYCTVPAHNDLLGLQGLLCWSLFSTCARVRGWS